MPDSRGTRATIVDVAQAAGVAISSASAALNDRPGVSEKTRARVREAADALRYVPSLRAKSLSSKRAYSVGLIVERDFTVLESDPFFSAFIGGVEESLAPHDYALSLQIVADESTKLDRHLELADSRRVDGLLLSELRSDDPRVAAFVERDTPIVGVNPGPDFPFPAVRQDNAEAVHALVAHLHALGHRRVAHVSGPSIYVHSQQRLRAWTTALAAHGLQPGTVVESDFTHDGGYRAADLLLGADAGAVGRAGAPRADGPPTAVFCANDLMAIGFMNRAAELGFRVPRDLSVAGFDGITLGTYIRPTLTTIATSPHALGREAARLLIDDIVGREAVDSAVEPAALVVRKSTGPVPTA